VNGDDRRVRILDLLPHRLGERLVAEAEKVTGSPVALYVVDLDGIVLRRMAGDTTLPEEIAIANAVGPEIGTDGGADLQRCVEEAVPGKTVTPLWLRGRAQAAFVGADGGERLAELATEGAAALELALRYTDDFHLARRRMRTTPAAELQEDLLPPRIGRIEGAALAATILPAYEVGGDWFDYAQNQDQLYFALGDAVGKGPVAAAVSALSLSALRSARRSGESLLQSVVDVHESIKGMENPRLFLTGVIARWDPADSTLQWFTCGHPRPLVVAPDGTITELDSPAATLPLGLLDLGPPPLMDECRLEPGSRIVIYSDGVTERRSESGGFFGVDGLRAAIEPDQSAEQTVTAIVAAVQAASTGEVRDDASVLVLALDGG
jgi:serine phosphatase RsbU (regulator of sigma subunit)